jgi:hypothetical protein
MEGGSIVQLPPRATPTSPYPRSSIQEHNTLRAGPRGQLSAHRYLCGQDPQRREASRLAGGAADEVRVHHQSQSRKSAQPNDPAVGAFPGGPSNQVNKRMAEPDENPVTMQELLVSSLAQTDALTKLLIEKGLITREEFMQRISEERATYQKLLNPTWQ